MSIDLRDERKKMVKTNNIIPKKSGNTLSEKGLLLQIVKNNSYLKFKYIIEPIVAAILLISILPFLALVYITILLIDRHNPIFIQERPGENTYSFFIYKFRTMEKLSRSDYRQSENKITKLGYFLRKWKIDELPQLINVIKGDMSLVGPRPEPLEYYCDIIENYPKFKHKYFVKPGLTGLSQLEYYNSTATVDGAMEKYSYDIAYIMDISFLNDMKLFFRTAKVIVKKNLS